MADIESNIRIGVDTSDAMASIKMLQAQISAFQRQMASSSAANADSARKLRRGLLDDLAATGQWSASIKTIKSSSESFTTALEKNKLSMGEYFKYAGASTKTFGKLFTTEFNTIEKVARERVKDLQTQYISLGRDANGALKAIAVRPLKLDMESLATQTAMAAQKQQIFNQLLKQGSTNLLNFGKNTQWAGRQLMVGFTIPLSIFGTTAAKTFMDLEKQAIKFKRVYGDLFTAPEETESMVKALQELSIEFTKYGVAVEKTMGLAADAAAMGKTGTDLLAQVTEANRLAVLGNVEQSQALETTISVTNAFGVATDKLASKIDFLNAVENQTVTSIEDLTIAIPKAGPVVKQLGGDVEDLAYFLTAMKEGGINASEGANALKSGLASLINPTDKASQFLQGFGINIKNIVNANKGDIKGLVTDFAQALDTLDPLNRAQAIEQLFGKFQFSRLSTLFQNVIAEGTQAERVLELTNSTVEELASLSQKELGNVADSTTFRLQKAVEELRLAIAPIGEQFLKLITPIIEFATKIIEQFNGLSDGAKSFITGLTILLGAVGPVALMTFGLLANGIANIIKGFVFVRDIFLKTGKQSTVLGEQIDYMTNEQLNAAAVAASLDQIHQKLIQTFSVEAGAVSSLADVYRKAFNEQQRFDTGRAMAKQAGMRLASGIVSVPGPKGAGDIVPAMLSPGEAVIPADAAKKYAPLVQGMISGNIPGFNKGVFLGMPRSGKSTGKNRDAAQQIYEMFLQSSYKNVPPTEYGHQLAPTSGHSFPIFGLGGVYMAPGGEKVFVKPVMDEKAALAEMRGTQIARQAHGLKAPEQRIVVIRDPQDPNRQRRFLALESKLDSTFVNNDPMAVFNEDQYFKQLVASLLRVDKDLSAGNVFGNVVADVGPAGVFNRASGVRDYEQSLPSMEEQAMVNLLGIKGGAKRAFAESTLALMAGLTPQQYHQRMVSEIQQVLPLLKQTIASFGLTDPKEIKVYADMVKRLEQGLTVDWSNFHAIHSAVKLSKPKQTSSPVPGYANGVVSVPGPKGKGDVVPAMLSPGEAVIPADKAKKYGSLISAMISGNIPGFKGGLLGAANEKYQKEISAFPELADAIDAAILDITSSSEKLTQSKVFEELENQIKPLIKLIKTTVEFNKGKGPSGTSNTGVNAAHGNKRKILTPEEARMIGEQMIAAGFGGGTAKALAASTRPVQAFSNLTFPMPRAFNSGDMSGTAGADWINQNPGRFTSMIAKNAKLDANDPGLIEFGNNVAKALEKVGATAVSESNFEEIIAQQIEILAEGAAKKALTEARDTYQTFNVVRTDSSSGSPTREAAQAGTGINAENQVLQGSQQRSYRAGAFRKLLKEFNADAEKFVLELASQLTASIKNGLKINSPSKEFSEISQGVAEGVRSGADDAQQAGRVIGKTIANTAAASVQSQGPKVYKLPGLRRVTTDINVYQREMEAFSKRLQSVFDRIMMQHNRLGQSFNNYFASISSKMGPAFDINTRQQIVPNAMPTDAAVDAPRAFSGLESLNSTAMQISFAFSSLATTSSMLGIEMGAINEALYGMSNALFAVTAVLPLLTAALRSQLVITLKNNAVQAFSGGFSAIANVFKSGGIVAGFRSLATQIGSLGKGLAAASPLIGKLASGFIKFIPILGWVATAFTVFQLFADVQEKQKQKIEGMSNAAFAAGEKLKSLASYAGFTPTRDPGTRFADTNIPSEGLTASERTAAVGISQSEEFKSDIEEGGKFYQDVQNLKNATLAEAEASLQTLYAELLAIAPEGTDPAVIKATVAALAAAAGKGDVSLDIPVTLNPYSKGNENAVQRFVAEQRNAIPELDINRFEGRDNQAEVEAAARLAGSATVAGIEQLNTQFENGLLDVGGYTKAVHLLTAGLYSLDYTARQAAITQVFENYGVPKETFSDIKQIEDQLLLIKALASGAVIDPEIWTNLTLDDDPNASEDDRKKAAQAEEDLADAIVEANNKTSKSYIERKNAQIAAQAAIDTAATDAELERLESIQEELGGVTEALGSEAAAYKFLRDEKYRNLLLDAQIKDQQAGGGTANVDALMESYKKLNEVTSEVDFGAALADLREDDRLKKELEANGYSAAAATAILNDEMLEQARANALANGTLDQFNEDLEEYLRLTNNGGPGGGTPDKTPFEEAIDSLKKQRTEILNTASTYSKLRKAGVDVGKAFRIAKDPVLAAALASEKVGTKKWRELLDLINKVNAELVVTELKDLTRTNIIDAKTIKNTQFLEKAFTKMGYSADQIDKILEQIGNNPDLVQKFVNDLRDGKVDAASIRDYLASIKNIKVKLSVEEMESEISNAFSDISEGISAQRQQIDLDFEFGTNKSGKNNIDPLTGLPFNTKDINKKIKDAEKYISERTYAIDDYEYQLSGIQEQEDEINKVYDERIKALEDVKKANDQIAESQKGQLTLADALSQGDIAAAARAVQEIRAADAEKAYEDQKDILEKSKELELRAIRSESGLSRIQIEEKIKDLKKEIAEKEEEILEPQQKSLELAEDYRDAANDSVTYLGKNESEWKKIETQVALAKTGAEGYKKAIEDAIALIPQLSKAYSVTSTGTVVDPKQARIDQLNTLIQSNRDKVTKDKSVTAEDKRLMAENVGYIEELRGLTGNATTRGGYAVGGKVSGPGTASSDSIPAMLSNGEYVIKASSVRNLGVDFLDFLNKTGQVPGFAKGGLIIPDKPTKTTKSVAPTRSAPPKDIEKIEKFSTPANKKFNLQAAMAADKKLTSKIISSKPIKQAGASSGTSATVKAATGEVPFVPSQAMLDRGRAGEQNLADLPALFVPGLGNALSANALVGSLERKDYPMATLDAIGVIPGFGNIVKGVTKSMLTTSKAKKPSKIKNTIDELIAKEVLRLSLKNPRIAIGMTPSGVEHAFKDKAIKNFFQVGESGKEVTRASGYVKERIRIEEAILGIPKDAPSSARPIYGTVTSPLGTLLPYTLAQKMPGITGDALRMLDPRFNNVANKYMYNLGSNASDIATSSLAQTRGGLKGTFTLGDTFRIPENSKAFNLGSTDAISAIIKELKSPTSQLRNISPYSLPYLEAQISQMTNPFDFINKLRIPITQNEKGAGFGISSAAAKTQAKNFEQIIKDLNVSGIKTGTFRTLMPQWQWLVKRGMVNARRSPIGRFAINTKYSMSQTQQKIKDTLLQKLAPKKGRREIDWDDNTLASGGLVKPAYLRMGGMLPYKAEGGQIFKPLGTDKVPAMLTPGEFVVSRPAVQNYGVDKLRAINSGTYNGDSVYNYSVNVNVATDANPDQIARSVITEIKRIDSQKIRGNRF